MQDKADSFTTDIPGRLDRLPWDRFHTLVVIALGVTWILDGLEVTLVGALAGAIRESPSLALSESQIGLSASAYLVGAVIGAVFFGRLTDRIGRRKIFFITVAVYMVASVATGFSWNFVSFAFFRALTGVGIGGECAAVNSAIQELIPARRRGTVDLCVNGTFWVGAAIGSLSAVFVLDPALVDPEIGWRAAFIVGGVLALFILVLRRWIPESPRWLMVHGRPGEADAILDGIEAGATARHGPLPPPGYPPIRLRRRAHTSIAEVVRTMLRTHPDRTLLGVVLMACQAFCYNAIFFTYALVLTRFYGVGSHQVGWYLLPFALGNVLGPLTMGHLFDSIGRRTMITLTYAVAGILMAATGLAFHLGWLTAVTQTICWTVIFFFASSAASAAYLTVGEGFPLEIRAMAIALFYAFGTAIGGVAGPALFGWLIQGGQSLQIMGGFLLAAFLMLVAAATEWKLGFAAEGMPLESVARPLSAHD